MMMERGESMKQILLELAEAKERVFGFGEGLIVRRYGSVF
jgi:hypothetical protein